MTALLLLLLALPAAAERYPESVVRPPVYDADPAPDVVPRCCRSRPEDYSVCRDCDRDLIDGFQFSNVGVNRVVTRPYEPLRMSPQRWFQFDLHLESRQDLSLWLADMPSPEVASFLETYLMFFPRRVVPSINVESGRFTVLLPTGEPVFFDQRSKEIVGGVLAEDGPQEAGVFARLSYTGSGVMLRADKRAGDPRLWTTAVISRGSRSCRVPSAELWTPPEPIVFRFPTDEAFDAFLRGRCGFGLDDPPAS